VLEITGEGDVILSNLILSYRTFPCLTGIHHFNTPYLYSFHVIILIIPFPFTLYILTYIHITLSVIATHPTESECLLYLLIIRLLTFFYSYLFTLGLTLISVIATHPTEITYLL